MASGDISSIIPYTVNFSLVVSLAVYYGKGPLAKLIYQRHERQKDVFDVAARKEKESEDQMKRVKKLLSELPQEKKNILEESQRLKAIEMKSFLEKTEKEKERLSKDMDRTINSEKMQARKFLQNHFVDQIVKITKKNITLRVKEENHKIIISAAIRNTKSHAKSFSQGASMEVDT